jgi:hypothetical protein
VSIEKLLAARDLLETAKRNLQLLDAEIASIKEGRAAVRLADDMSSEHRTALFGVVDDLDGQPGVSVATGAAAGFGNPFTGTIRVQEDAAFVVERVLVTGTRPDGLNSEAIFKESVLSLGPIMCALKDGNTGRNLTPGLSVGPVDLDRGAVPLSVLSSFRGGLGASFKNSLFSEFVIPRAGTVKVTLWNMMPDITLSRIHISLLGYKVYGA